MNSILWLSREPPPSLWRGELAGSCYPLLPFPGPVASLPLVLGPGPLALSLDSWGGPHWNESFAMASGPSHPWGDSELFSFFVIKVVNLLWFSS